MKFVDLLSSYLPSIIVKELLETKGEDDIAPTRTSYDAVCLFADVSGFTAMSESMRESHGESTGVEHLAKHMNSYFSQLVKIIASEGGDVFKFAGDAMIILWPVSDVEDMVTRTRRAVQCAIRVQQLGSELRVGKDVTLSVKMGIGVGSMAVLRIGGVMKRRESLAVGEPLIQAFAAEQFAEAGDVVVSPKCWGLIHEYFRATPVSSDQTIAAGAVSRTELDTVHNNNQVGEDLVYENLKQTVTHFRRIDVSWRGGEPLRKRNKHFYTANLNQSTVEQEALIRRYVPGAILRALHPSHPEFELWSSEIRTVSTLFVHLGLQDHDLLAAAEYDDAMFRVHAALTTAQTAVYQFEGSVNKFLMDDKGSTLVVVFGLPPYSHENDPVRAVLCALSMHQRLREHLRLEASIGIATGKAFCGVLGSQTRKEYSVLGDSVNLSARLMQAVRPGSGTAVLCDWETFVVANKEVHFTALEPLVVKGKSQRVRVFHPKFMANQPMGNRLDFFGVPSLTSSTIALEVSPRLRLIGPVKNRTNRISSTIKRMTKLPNFRRAHSRADLNETNTEERRSSIDHEHQPKQHDESKEKKFTLRWLRNMSPRRNRASSFGESFDSRRRASKTQDPKIHETHQDDQKEEGFAMSNPLLSFSSEQPNLAESQTAQYQALLGAPTKSIGTISNKTNSPSSTRTKHSSFKRGAAVTSQPRNMYMHDVVLGAIKRLAEKPIPGIQPDLLVSDFAMVLKGSEMVVPMYCTDPHSIPNQGKESDQSKQHPIPRKYLSNFSAIAYSDYALSVPTSTKRDRIGTIPMLNRGFPSFRHRPKERIRKLNMKRKEQSSEKLVVGPSNTSKNIAQLSDSDVKSVTKQLREFPTVVMIPSSESAHVQSNHSEILASLLSKKILLVEYGISSTTLLIGASGVGKSHILSQFCGNMLNQESTTIQVAAKWIQCSAIEGILHSGRFKPRRKTDPSSSVVEDVVQHCLRARSFCCFFDIVDRWFKNLEHHIGSSFNKEKEVSNLVTDPALTPYVCLLNGGLGTTIGFPDGAKQDLIALFGEHLDEACKEVLLLQYKLFEHIMINLARQKNMKLCVAIDNGSQLDPQSLRLIESLSERRDSGLMFVIATRSIEDSVERVPSLTPFILQNHTQLSANINDVICSPKVTVFQVKGLSELVGQRLLCSFAGRNVVEVDRDLWELCIMKSDCNPMILQQFVHFLKDGGGVQKRKLLEFEDPLFPRDAFDRLMEAQGVPSVLKRKASSKKNKSTLTGSLTYILPLHATSGIKVASPKERRSSCSKSECDAQGNETALPLKRVKLTVPKEQLQEVEFDVETFDIQLQKSMWHVVQNCQSRAVKSRRIPSSVRFQNHLFSSDLATYEGQGEPALSVRKGSTVQKLCQPHRDESLDSFKDLAFKSEKGKDYDNNDIALFNHISQLFRSKSKDKCAEEYKKHEWNSIQTPCPPSIAGLLGALLDRLSPFEQLVLKVAAMIGRVFTLRHVQDSYPITEDQVVEKIERICEQLSDLHGIFYKTKCEKLDDHFVYKFRNDFMINVIRERMLNKHRISLERRLQTAATRYRANQLLFSLESGEECLEKLDSAKRLSSSEGELYSADPLCFGKVQIEKTKFAQKMLRNHSRQEWKGHFAVLMQDRLCIYRSWKDLAGGSNPVHVVFLPNAKVNLLKQDDESSDESIATGVFTIDAQCWLKKGVFKTSPHRYTISVKSVASATHWVSQLELAVECCAQVAAGEKLSRPWPSHHRAKIPEPSKNPSEDRLRTCIRFAEIQVSPETFALNRHLQFAPFVTLCLRTGSNALRYATTVTSCEARPLARVCWEEANEFVVDYVGKECLGFLEIAVWNKSNERLGYDELLGFSRLSLQELFSKFDAEESDGGDNEADSKEPGRYFLQGDGKVGQSRYSTRNGDQLSPLPPSGKHGVGFALQNYFSRGRKVSCKVFLDAVLIKGLAKKAAQSESFSSNNTGVRKTLDRPLAAPVLYPWKGQPGLGNRVGINGIKNSKKNDDSGPSSNALSGLSAVVSQIDYLVELLQNGSSRKQLKTPAVTQEWIATELSVLKGILLRQSFSDLKGELDLNEPSGHWMGKEVLDDPYFQYDFFNGRYHDQDHYYIMKPQTVSPLHQPSRSPRIMRRAYSDGAESPADGRLEPVSQAATAAALEIIKSQSGRTTVYEVQHVLERFYKKAGKETKEDGENKEDELLLYLSGNGTLEGPQPLSFFANRLAEGTVDPDLEVFSPTICDTSKPLAEFTTLSRAIEFFSIPNFEPPSPSSTEQQSHAVAGNQPLQSEWGRYCDFFRQCIGPASVNNTMDDGTEQLNTFTIPPKLDICSWEFRLFEVKGAEARLGMITSIFCALDLDAQFSIPHNTFKEFVEKVRLGMCKHDAPYHNYDHACDVIQGAFVFLKSYHATALLEPVEVLGVLVAAFCHDLEHPGTSNAYQVRSQSNLSLLYNDKSVLENHHCAQTFKILGQEDSNIAATMTPAAKFELRKIIIECILATDMVSHFTLTADLKDCAVRYREYRVAHEGKSHKREATFTCSPNFVTPVVRSKSISAISSSDFCNLPRIDKLAIADRMVIAKALLHCADISNPTRPWEYSKIWSNRVLEEFFKQGDLEKKNNYPVSPNMNREYTSQAHMSLNFIDFIVAPIFLELVRIVPGIWPVCEMMAANRKKWEQILEAKLLLQEMPFGQHELLAERSSTAFSNGEMGDEAEIEQWKRRQSAFLRMMSSSTD